MDRIKCKILTHCRSSINHPPPPHPPLRMRSQTLPFLLKKNENYLKIIKVPLHGHKMFAANHTIQYHCIKYCSQCRRGYYNGLNREALPEKVTFSGFRYMKGKGLVTGASRRRAPVLKCRRFLSFFQRYIVRDTSLTEIYRWLVTLARSLKSYRPFSKALEGRPGGHSRERL